ncbi:MAG: hypothetical protein QM737_21240 [Ferruginibacter sp.]
MKKISLLLLIVVSFSLHARSQYITIPDAAFKNALIQKYPTCFNASGMMDTTCSLILNDTLLDLSFTNVSNWEGFQYFRNLKQFFAGGQITSLPALPATLERLNISGASLSSLPTLPAGLKYLYLEFCLQLGSLPTLPASLLELTWNQSNIVTLPTLPAGLTLLSLWNSHLQALPATLPPGLLYLNCGQNDSISVLPPLPATLKGLSCYQNRLTSLGSSLPPALTYLDFQVNQVTSIPAIPAGVTDINGNYNQLTSIPALPNGLKSLYLAVNNISTFPATLPPALTMLDVTQNQLTSIPTLPNTIVGFYCGGNHLSSLPNLPTAMKTFFCYNNQLTALPQFGPDVTSVNCSGNQLVSLPPLPAGLTNLQCASNQLLSLPELPPYNGTGFELNCVNNPNLHCLPVLPAAITITMSNLINCIPAVTIGYSSITVVDTATVNPNPPVVYDFMSPPFPFCSEVNNSYHCEAFPVMKGYVYNDNNNNGVKDANEPYRANIRITLSNGNFTTTNSNGYYIILADSIGNYTLACNAPNYFAAVPPSYAFNFSTYDTLVANNFALQATATVDSLTLSLNSLEGAARLGRPLTYFVNYENSGTTTLTPSVVVNYSNSQLLYDSSSNAAVTNNGTSLQLNETAMVPGERRGFIAYFHVSPASTIGDTIRGNAHISAGTAAAVDSVASEIRGPFDPNDKYATPVLTPEQVSSGKYINYNIRFQNVGNDTAFNVVIADTLSNLLQASTLEVINTSHPCKATVKDNIVYFEFLNILLPDSNVNQLKSHGFVSFKIKPQSNVAVNTSIPNYASIYFDYNLPVVTNTAITQIQNAVVVPLKLFSFNVERQTKATANAYWTTSNEDHVKDFSIEVSTNGKDYTGIASATSKGGQYNNYTKQVAVPTSSIVYYRLKITDIDGRFYYGPVVTLRSNAEAAGFSFRNNPVKDKLVISIEDASLIGTIGRIINTQGAVVQKIYFRNDPVIVDIRSLPAGTYVLETINGSRQFIVIK